MTYRDWLPSVWGDDKDDEDNPFRALRKQIDTLFEDFGHGSVGMAGELAIRSNVSETGKEICITAELPGIEKKDVEVSTVGNRITVKGEKKSEKEEKKEEEGRHFHRIERTSGSFRRTMTVPFEIDPDSVSAEVKNGVLTVIIPKPPEAVEKTKKIKIKESS